MMFVALFFMASYCLWIGLIVGTLFEPVLDRCFPEEAEKKMLPGETYCDECCGTCGSGEDG
jgi:hypothetical protein